MLPALNAAAAYLAGLAFTGAYELSLHPALSLTILSLCGLVFAARTARCGWKL